MFQTVVITEGILTLNDVQEMFNLSQTTDPQVFPEWFEGLPKLTDTEKESLTRLKNRFLYYVANGAITKGTILQAMNRRLELSIG